MSFYLSCLAPPAVHYSLFRSSICSSYHSLDIFALLTCCFHCQSSSLLANLMPPTVTVCRVLSQLSSTSLQLFLSSLSSSFFIVQVNYVPSNLTCKVKIHLSTEYKSLFSAVLQLQPCMFSGSKLVSEQDLNVIPGIHWTSFFCKLESRSCIG